MNSDPYDSAVWRSFGMLDADESAIFDEAARIDPLLRGALLEQDRLAAAIAVATTTPVVPKDGQLDRLEARLGLHKVRRGPWIAAITGWAAAAALAAMWLLDHHGVIGTGSGPVPLTGQPVPNTGTSKSAPIPVPAREIPRNPAADGPAVQSPSPATASLDENVIKSRVRAETKRLVQEIEVLRDNLEKFQNRDRALFEPVPGMALPIVMTMNPPGHSSDDNAVIAANTDPSPIHLLLAGDPSGGDLRGFPNGAKIQENSATVEGADLSSAAPFVPTAPQEPSAIPIYDPARDSGTLLVSNLPPAEEGVSYNLWVSTPNADKPIFVGTLPASDKTKSSESFDFTLGTNMALPSGFMLTKDPSNQPASPSKANTVLQGPPTPGR